MVSNQVWTLPYLFHLISSYLQLSRSGIFPPVLPYQCNIHLRGLRSHQRQFHHQFCLRCDPLSLRFLDGQECDGQIISGAEMVESHRWGWHQSLGVWIKKGKIQFWPSHGLYSISLMPDSCMSIIFKRFLFQDFFNLFICFVNTFITRTCRRRQVLSVDNLTIKKQFLKHVGWGRVTEAMLSVD